MYLKRLELVGFKSFADKTELEFGPGMTAVVGPNGSGKSNVCDALRWVLGELSARELRGAKMEDVIFAGSSAKKPLGYAQVAITFDNGDKALPLPFAEIEVARRVDRAGGSEYFINQQPCRLKDILDLFLDTGIGKENYSIVGQGQIDQILSAKPEDRRALFEEAAGVARYKTRKREAARKLADTEQNLLRLGDLIGELDGRLADLAVQAETARRYRELETELSSLEIGLLARQLAHATRELTRWQAEAAAQRARLQEVDLSLGDLEGALDSARNLISALDQELAVLQTDVVQAAAQLERAEGRLNLLRQESEQADREQQRLEAEAAVLGGRQQGVAAELAAARTRLAEVAGDLAAARAELAEREAALAAVQAQAGAAARAGEEGRNRVFQLAQAAAERRNLAVSEVRVRDRAAERLARLARDEADARAQGQVAGAERARREAQLAELTERRAELEAGIAVASGREETAAGAVQVAADAMARLRERIEAVSARLGLLDELKASFEGFTRGPRTVLQGRDQRKPWARGVIGAVAELVRTEPKYERAIEVALGGAVQNIITQTDVDAKSCIAALKQAGAGRATFLPLSVIRGGALREDELRDFQAEKGFIGCALDLCRFEHRLRPAVSNLLGRVAVAKDMDAAIAIGRRTGFRHRIVTLDGELVHPGGAMTGGSAEGRASGMLAREREREELTAELAVRREELARSRADLEAARAGRTAAAQDRQQLEQELKRLEVAAAAAGAERDRHDAEVRRWQQHLAAVQEEAAAVTRESESGAEAARRLMSQAEELEAEQAALEADVARLGEDGQALAARTAAAGEAATAVRVRMAGLEQEERSLAAQEARLAAEAETLAAEAARRGDQRGALVARQGALAEELGEATREAEAAAVARRQLEERQQGLQARRLQAQADANAREREVRSLRRQQSDLLARISEANASEARLQAEVEGITGRLAEQHGLSPAETAGRELAEEMLPFARQRVGALRDEIRELGPVNPGAIEEHARAHERHEFLHGQRADLEEAKESLYRAIDELDRRIVHQFQESFHAVRREFQRVYAELFEGGRADLLLMDESNLLETGVEIMVQPPGKKLTPLSLLSGGERAMTAIALLFALLRYKPTPFVVLDEVEAALDEANVERVGRYLKQLTRETQFICITHQRGTMEVADALYGVTMEGTGVSRVVSVRFTDVSHPAQAS